MKNFYIFLVALVMINSAAAQWEQQNSETTEDLNSVYFTDSNTGYAVGTGGTILKTTNGGLNWTPQNSNTSLTLTSVYFPKTDTGYAVGAEIILKTTDGGENWTSQTSDFSLRSVYFC
jgi:photosystem II stability/assembly factor-like uncharacterized protein